MLVCRLCSAAAEKVQIRLGNRCMEVQKRPDVSECGAVY